MITKPRLECPADLVPLLGTISDEEAARLSRTSHPTVRRWRRERGIPAFTGNGRPPVDLVPPEGVRAALDVLPGSSWAYVARMCGVSRQRVHQALRDGLAPDVLAEWLNHQEGKPRRGRPPEAIPDRDELIRLGFGTDPDKVIATELEIPVTRVTRWRKIRGIPIARRSTYGDGVQLTRAEARAMVDATMHDLGLTTYGDFAAHLGVTSTTVRGWLSCGVSQRTLARRLASAPYAGAVALVSRDDVGRRLTRLRGRATWGELADRCGVSATILHAALLQGTTEAVLSEWERLASDLDPMIK